MSFRTELPDVPLPMLFMRDYRFLSGGHLKVYDYFMHVRASRVYRPLIYFSVGSRLDDGPWADLWKGDVVDRPFEAAAYFLAGLDWRIADAFALDLTKAPVYNLIQHFRHVDPADARFPYLARPAIRICVTQTLADRVRAAGANGPVIAIEAAPPLTEVDRSADCERFDVFVSASKDRALGTAVASGLLETGCAVDLELEVVPRRNFLRRMAAAHVAILLPSAIEGRYLPPLEAMTLGIACVTLDAVGNREFCRNERTCLVAERDARSVVHAARRLLSDPILSETLRRAGRHESLRHSLVLERSRFLAVIDAEPPGNRLA